MAYEMKERQGALFENDRKTEDKQPDYTGTFKLNGEMWRVAGWARRSGAGKVYSSLAISEPKENAQQSNVGLDDPELVKMRAEMKKKGELARQKFEGTAANDDFADDDVPF